MCLIILGVAPISSSNYSLQVEGRCMIAHLPTSALRLFTASSNKLLTIATIIRGWLVFSVHHNTNSLKIDI